MKEKEAMDSPLDVKNGPSQEEINEWKNKFGEIYSAKFEQDQYIYRPIRRFEYKQVLQLGQDPNNRAFVEEKVSQMCVIWPKIEATEMSKLKAGTISTLVDLIMAASNFGITEEPVKL